MLLRRITKHVKDQNWFAVGLDFFIVVVGILIAFQITNWNEGRQGKARENAVLIQIQEEFTEIKTAIEKQNAIREGYVENIRNLIIALEDTGPIPDDLAVKTALHNVRSTGRRPAQSAAYLQLMASGELATLSNEKLQKALVKYHTRLQRDAFILPELMKAVIEEMSSNEFVEFDISRAQSTGAAIDRTDGENQDGARIRSYDFEGLRKFETRYEAMFVMHAALLNTDRTQLELANEILNQISGETKK